MISPEISVVVPTFEQADLVSECLTSIARQREVEIELIVTDDSSTDQVVRIVERMAAKLIAGARTGNPVDNWNHGLERATTPIRLLVHQDEILLDPLYLRRAVDTLGDPEVSAVIGRTVVSGGLRPSRFNRVSAVARRLPARQALLPLVNWIGPTAAFVFRGEARFDPRLVQLVDVDFYIVRLREGRHVLLSEPCVGSRGYHSAQITAAIDPVEIALAEIDRLPIDPASKALARIATRGRRWSR